MRESSVQIFRAKKERKKERKKVEHYSGVEDILSLEPWRANMRLGRDGRIDDPPHRLQFTFTHAAAAIGILCVFAQLIFAQLLLVAAREFAPIKTAPIKVCCFLIILIPLSGCLTLGLAVGDIHHLYSITCISLEYTSVTGTFITHGTGTPSLHLFFVTILS